MTVQAGVHEKGKLSLSDIINDLKDEHGFQKAGAIAFFVGVAAGKR
jgi:molybdopterin synthase catalytic subunit